MTLPSGSVTLAANLPSRLDSPAGAPPPPPPMDPGAAGTGTTLTSVAVAVEAAAEGMEGAAVEHTDPAIRRNLVPQEGYHNLGLAGI